MTIRFRQTNPDGKTAIFSAFSSIFATKHISCQPMEDTVGFHGEFWERPQDFGLPKGLSFCRVLLDLLKNQRYGRNFLSPPPYIERTKSTSFSHKKGEKKQLPLKKTLIFLFIDFLRGIAMAVFIRKHNN
ncbi:hypothetical protein [Anaerotignum lactatifermentans]|uniref:hypothetical protein n=1 Tax=Anaerotignum lactatifermentans TaxID=160404 RepID=UPI0011604E79|nr:hypothetical protein [Anaerotignum lactatifermentans]